MYESLYGLGGRPFALTPDPRFLLLTPKHREALSHVEYVLSGRTGLALLLGEAGTGKTTLLRAAVEQAHKDVRVVTLDNPTLTRAEFFEFLATAFQLGATAAKSKTRALRELTASLQEQHKKGGLTALVVDEAQSLSDELLEEIRLLANIETPTAKLISIILAGQPELGERLNQPSLRQFKQRIALRGVLAPLTLSETADYIRGRLRMVGGEPTAIFTADAVQAVFAHSAGIPRTISVICENALVTGFALGARPVGGDIVSEVCRDLDLRPVAAAPVSARSGHPVRVREAVEAPAPAPAPSPAAAAAPAAATERPRTADGRRRSVLDYVPFLSLGKRRGQGAAPIQTQYFDLDGRRGVVVTSSAELPVKR
jgi:general secretion pathway protein A